MNNVSAILFDLDGTLIEAAPDLHGAANELLARHGLGPLTLDQVVSMIGNGIAKLVERAFAAAGAPLDESGLKAASDEMVAIYGRRLTRLTTLNEGAAGAVAAVAARGLPIGVVTNKPLAATETILAHFGLRDAMTIVIGGDSGLPRKPAPDMLLDAARRLGLPPAEIVMVGDSPSDVNAARAAGMRSIAVRGGYTPVPVEDLGATAIIGTLRELAALLASKG